MGSMTGTLQEEKDHPVLKDKGSLAVIGFGRECVHIPESSLHAKS